MNENNTRKALVINSEEPPTAAKSGWIPLNELPKFVKQINVPEITQDKDGSTAAETSSLVSGMPSVFAKANLFRNALDFGKDLSSHSNGIQRVYSSHILEWRGFLSCIALEYSHLSVHRIYLKYTDNQPISATQNVYEAFGAFGNMLFEKEMLWSIHEEGSGKTDPYVDAIKFHDKLVGGTSPESFLFTAASYKIDNEYPFTSRGKFIDPYKKANNSLTQENSNTIRAFILNILNNNLGKFSDVVKKATEKIEDPYVNVREQLKNWYQEIEAYEQEKGFRTKPENLNPPEVNKFHFPYSVLFNYSTELYGLVGVIYNERPQGSDTNKTVKFKPTDLLLPKDAKVIKIRMEDGSESNPLYINDRPLLLLQAKVINRGGETGRFAFFTLPLTSKALEIFGENLPALLGLADNIQSKLRGTFDETEYKLSVEFELTTIENSKRKFVMNYDLVDIDEIKYKDILIWPNFISTNWKRYFMYSEIPHNGVGYKAVPFVGEIINGTDLKTIYKNENDDFPFLVAENGVVSKYTGTPLKKDPEVKLIIENNAQVQDNKYKYEIYESNLPFKGLKFSYNNADAGFGIINYTKNEPNLTEPRNPKCPIFYNSQDSFRPVNLGIDFGSTNTSIAFYDPDEGGRAKEFELTNKRISLLSNDNKDNRERPAMEDEIFFFQNERIKSNALKSTLTLHQSRRIASIPGLTPESTFAKEIYGGFPCFEYNLPIRNSDNSKINLVFPRAENVELVYNMKWSDSDVGHKTVYLKTLLLHVYAQLFSQKYVPTKLKWSYPSAMTSALRFSYQSIYRELVEVSPLVGLVDNDLTVISAGQEDAAQQPNKIAPDNNGARYPQSNRVEIPVIVTDYELPSADNFVPIRENTALSESSAVANYFLTERGNEINIGNYLIILDIGGSTTDISVITRNQSGQSQIIKQNSFRWAAQRISQAIPYINNFKRVLLEYCHSENIRITGLNDGGEQSFYKENTASYFYEQIVNRIVEPQQFKRFYNQIAGKCPELMSTNLYVTGLIMYYAGQLTYRLTKDLNQIENQTGTGTKPIFNVVLAGKGARIFDWFTTFNKELATTYYDSMFESGIGGREVAQACLRDFNIRLENGPNSAVKYEVSKGLALPIEHAYVLNSRQSVEIIGEDGFHVVRPGGEPEMLESSNAITGDMMRHIGGYFRSTLLDSDNPYPRFSNFYKNFNQSAKNYFGVSLGGENYQNGIKEMNIEGFIKGLPEYRKAKDSNGENFDFVAPIFIMEGIQFYENTIMNYLKNQFKG